MSKLSVKRISATVTALMTSVTPLSASGACFALNANAAENSVFPYTMFAASEAEGALTVNSQHFCLNGRIATNGTIVSNLGADQNYKMTENAATDMPFVGAELESRYFYNAQSVDVLDVTDWNVNLNNAMDISGTASVQGNVNMNGSIRADSDIHISGNVANVNNAVIYSEFGDVTIDCSNVSLCGMIYAPLGDVVINADYINLNNVVIVADTITLNAKGVNANYGRQYGQALAAESETKASYIRKFNSYMMMLLKSSRLACAMVRT